MVEQFRLYFETIMRHRHLFGNYTIGLYFYKVAYSMYHASKEKSLQVKQNFNIINAVKLFEFMTTII